MILFKIKNVIENPNQSGVLFFYFTSAHKTYNFFIFKKSKINLSFFYRNPKKFYLPEFFKATLFKSSKNIGFFDFYKDHEMCYLASIKDRIDLNEKNIFSVGLTENEYKKYIYIENLNSINGYEREKALRDFNTLGYPNDLEVLNVLLKRLNDWVEPIRNLAKDVLINYIYSSKCEFIIENLNLVYHLKACKRSNHIDFITNIESFLSKKPWKLINGLKNNKSIARNCFFIIKKYNLLSDFDIIKTISYVNDVVIIGNISRHYLPHLDFETFMKLENLLCRNKNKDVARETLRLYVKFNIDKINKIKLSLVDKRLAVAETAWYLSKKEGIDSFEIYKKILLNYKLANNQELKTVFRIIDRLKLDVPSDLLKDIIYNSRDFPVKKHAIKNLFKITRNEKFIFELCLSGVEDLEILGVLFLNEIFTHKISFTSKVTTEDVYKIIMNCKTSFCKKTLINLIKYIFQEWEKLYLFLILFIDLNESEYKLKVINELKQINISFRNNDYEPRIREWINNHPGCLTNEISSILNQSYHGKKFLESMLT